MHNTHMGWDLHLYLFGIHFLATSHNLVSKDCAKENINDRKSSDTAAVPRQCLPCSASEGGSQEKAATDYANAHHQRHVK